MEKKKRGGARPGAGAPKKETVRISKRVPTSQAEELMERIEKWLAARKEGRDAEL